MPQCKTKPSDLGSLFLTRVWKAGEREWAVSIPSGLWSLWFSPENNHKCISPHSPRLELSESLGDISCQCMCPALINANESCVHEEKGQPLCLWGIGFHSKELGSNLTYNFNWVLRPRPVIGSPLQTPKSTTQQHILWLYQLFRIISQGTNPPSFGGLFSPKTDSKLWHKRYQTYYIMITVNGKN